MSQILNKGDIIINPNTQRPVKVGSRTWLSLVKKGVVSGQYRDPNELDEQPDDHGEVEQKIETLNATLPRGKQAVRGRGRYKGKIVKRNTRPKAEDISRYTAQIASRAVNNNIDALVESDDLEGMLERLILEEMMATRPAAKLPTVKRRTKKAAAKVSYELEEAEPYDEMTSDEEEASYLESSEEEGAEYY